MSQGQTQSYLFKYWAVKMSLSGSSGEMDLCVDRQPDRFPVGVSVRYGARKVFLGSNHLPVQKIQMNLITAGSVWVSHHLWVQKLLKLHTHIQNTSHRSLPPPKVLGQKAKNNHYGDSKESPMTLYIKMNNSVFLDRLRFGFVRLVASNILLFS